MPGKRDQAQSRGAAARRSGADLTPFRAIAESVSAEGGELVEEIGIPAISEHLMTVIDRRLARGENDAMAQVLEDK